MLYINYTSVRRKSQKTRFITEDETDLCLKWIFLILDTFNEKLPLWNHFLFMPVIVSLELERTLSLFSHCFSLYHWGVQYLLASGGSLQRCLCSLNIWVGAQERRQHPASLWVLSPLSWVGNNNITSSSFHCSSEFGHFYPFLEMPRIYTYRPWNWDFHLCLFIYNILRHLL